MITVACVCTGTKYPIEYVEKLRSMVARHLHVDHRFVCLVDKPAARFNRKGIEFWSLPRPLEGWWAKMTLFNPGYLWRDNVTIYLDLDTVILGNLTPLVYVAEQRDFAICANFTRRSGNTSWPCAYGSCVMTLAPGFGAHIWEPFWAERELVMRDFARGGDQRAIEHFHPGAPLLQDLLPDGYFIGRREFTDSRPDKAAIAVFAGNEKPHNSPHDWVREAWR